MNFFNYFKALTCAPMRRTPQFSTGIACYLAWMLSIVLVSLTFNFIALGIAFFASLLFMMCFFVGNYHNNTPNLVNMAPISHRKRTLYRYLAPFWMTFLAFVFLLAVAVVFAAVFTVIAAIAESGGGAASDGTVEEEAEDIYYAMGAYGGIFSFLYVVILYSCGMISGFIKRLKTRNIFMFSLCGGIVMSVLLMTIPYTFSNAGNGIVTPFVGACYEAMSLPWLCIAIWVLIAAGALGTAIYMGIKNGNPKNF